MPKKKKKRTEPGASSGVTIIDDLDTQYALESVEERWDKDLKEDQPVVEEICGGYSRKGNWEVLDVPTEDASPPRRRRAVDTSPPRRQSLEQDAANLGLEPAGIADSFASRGKVSRFSSTASGHAAGLQSGSEFGEREREYKANRDAELSKADPSLSGAQSSTVYRDKSGKKVDMLNEFMRQQSLKETKVYSAV